MKPSEIYLAKFPFGDTATMKLRPVLLLTEPVGTVPEVIVAYITSVIPPSLLVSDLFMDPTRPDHASTNLKMPSMARLHKLATIHQSSLVRHLGKVSDVVWSEVEDKLRDLFKL